jgi:hypothetical protein
MSLQLLLRAIGVLALVAGSLTAIADQSERFIGVHEAAGVQDLPAFASDRIELTPGVTLDIQRRIEHDTALPASSFETG